MFNFMDMINENFPNSQTKLTTKYLTQLTEISFQNKRAKLLTSAMLIISKTAVIFYKWSINNLFRNLY